MTRLRRRIAGPLAALALAAPAGAEEAADARPPAVAYTVTDGQGIEAPLDGREGSPLRGLALFTDPATGGCSSCHAAPGVARLDTPPGILADRLPPLPPPPEPPGPDAEPAEPDSTSELAPAEAPLPMPRPGGDAEEGDVAADDAAPPLLPLPVGPDLTGVAARMPVPELRLTVVNPRIANPRTRMPAYHHVSLALAERAPALRQPWLTARQIEDVVAYLATLDAPPEDEERGEADAAPADTPPENTTE
ncbi:MAG: hypothetical protein ACQEUZ_05055 [Pseudomonadota bacterium]